jgi:hypothetical protein
MANSSELEVISSIVADCSSAVAATSSAAAAESSIILEMS